MTRKELVEKFHLTKTKTKCFFYDGKSGEKSRNLYINNHGKLFAFYNNDLYTFNPYLPYEENMNAINGNLGAGYSWYH